MVSMIGKIIKGIAGFYYVHIVEFGIYECKAKGIFRKDNIKPLVGDEVEVEVLDESDKEGNIIKILPRRNILIRPAVANIDQALVLFAIADPKPHLNLLDRFLVTMEYQKIPTIICFNKLDLDDSIELERLSEVYKLTDYPTVFISVRDNTNIDEIKQLLKGKTTVVAGPSGSGKSSLINILQSDIKMEIGALSKKISRGKHTTRHSQLIAIDENSYIVDTPGFSSLYVENFERDELKNNFPDFVSYDEYCYFQGCIHIHEPNCGVKDAVEEGKISKSRYDNYVVLYDGMDDLDISRRVKKSK